MENVKSYATELQKMFQSNIAREHAYRPALQKLLDNTKHDSNVTVLNDPKRSEHGAPDFVIMKTKELTLGHVETKDLNVDLDKAETSEQLKRYYGYPNLILTNYLEFRFFKNGEKAETIVIGKLEHGGITFNENDFDFLENTLKEFMAGKPEPIKSGLQLAKIMGGKARRIRDNVRHFLNTESEKNQELEKIYEIIKKLLIHDLNKESFADMYAQTLVYGLFIARYNDKTLDNFTRQKARDLVPDSNPFLKTFFDHIAGASFDLRLAIIVNELCEVFSYSGVHGIMEKYTKQLVLFGDEKELPDPVIHFYEDFLKEYDPKQRIALGVFYTPLSVVRFIVRSIDELLRTEFGLDKGLADSSKIERTVVTQRVKHKEKIHRVQVLDPATGTGTFLNEVVNVVHSKFEGQEGRWNSYVNEDLLPRIYGFELMIASYTIAHLKLGLNLQSKGYKDFDKRLGIYLTNSLEEAPDLKGTLFEQIGLSFAITKEAEAAGVIKNKKPIMVVIGNPPYSGVSSNETEYANKLVKKYKVEPGGKQKLQERKHWLNDDYVKFIALAENMVAKNSDGVVGYITNHGYLDNPTFRGMRWHLLDTFDSIYVIDLHGNSLKKEVSPDGSKDENVFDIQQGVSIMLAVKTGKKKTGQLAKVYRIDLWGKRESKFEQLDKLAFEKMKWISIKNRLPNLVFAESGSAIIETEYQLGFNVSDLFLEKATGIVTARDGLVISDNRAELNNRIKQFSDDNLSDLDVRQRFFSGKSDGKYKAGDSRGWKLSESRKIIRDFNHDDQIKSITYRPFDIRFIYYHPKMVDWRREKIMGNFLAGDNIALEVCRQVVSDKWTHIFITDRLVDDSYVSNKTRERGYVLPLYIHHIDGSKTSNLKKVIFDQIEKIVGKVSPEDIFDYMYSVLYSPSYREKYKEFLKIDFPRIPFPKDQKQFKRLAEKGKELRELHLLKSPLSNNLTTTYPVEGSDKVEKVEFSAGRVYINGGQYFGNVPEVAWNFYIGGYQPAQKWLKDRKGKTLSSEDIEHYQKIIIALTETNRIMKEIDKEIK